MDTHTYTHTEALPAPTGPAVAAPPPGLRHQLDAHCSSIHGPHVSWYSFGATGYAPNCHHMLHAHDVERVEAHYVGPNHDGVRLTLQASGQHPASLELYLHNLGARQLRDALTLLVEQDDALVQP